MSKIVVIQRIFSNYRKPFFDKLKQKHNLLLLYSKNKSGIKQTEAPYAKFIRKIKYGNSETQEYLCVVKEIIKFKPNVVIHEFNPSVLSVIALFILKYILRFKLVLWGHGINKDLKFNPNSFKFIVRLNMAKIADAVIFYGNTNRDIFSKYIDKEKLFVANNAIDTSNQEKILRELSKKGKENIKRKLGLSTQYVVIFIGRFLKDKLLPHYYIKIIQKINAIANDLSFVFIGDGPEIDNFKNELSVSSIDNIKFMGAIHDDQKTGAFLFASDLMLMPGYVGLSLNHSFCYGTPVFTFKQGIKGPFHSPEIEYLKHGLNGYEIKSFDTDLMVNAIMKYLNDADKQKEVSRNAIDTIYNDVSIDNMLLGFNEAINYVENKK